MADENGKAAQAAGEPQPQAGDDKDKPQAGGGASPADEPMSLEEAKKLRKESQALRKRLEAFEADKKTADDAKLSEAERLKKQLTEYQDKETRWQAERRERDARDEVLSVLTDEKPDNKYRAKNPRAVYKLIKDDIEFSDKGEIANLSALLKQAKADYPELFGLKSAGSVNGGDGAHGTNAPTDMNAMIRQQAGRA